MPEIRLLLHANLMPHRQTWRGPIRIFAFAQVESRMAVKVQAKCTATVVCADYSHATHHDYALERPLPLQAERPRCADFIIGVPEPIMDSL